jgi:hypothetical protein
MRRRAFARRRMKMRRVSLHDAADYQRLFKVSFISRPIGLADSGE